jgi:transposase
MKTIPKSQWPDWIKKLLPGRKNVEVKKSKGHFYLYGYRNVWNKELKRPKKTTKYVGVLKQKGSRIREHGHVAFPISLLSEHRIMELLKKHFPNEWEELMVFLLNRLIFPSPLKRMGSWAEKTTLLSYLSIDAPSGKRLSKTLAKVGTNVKSQSAFMGELIKEGELLLYDGSVIYSTSDYNKLLEVGYDKGKMFLPKANITLLFSNDRNVPVHFRLFFGSVHEIRTVKTVIEEMRERNIIFIADKGYYKNKLYEDLRDAKIKFIIPLPRDDARIDYEKEHPKVFEYHGRIVRCTSYYVRPYWVYHYEDQKLKYSEISQYYKLKLKKRKVKLNEHWAGKIALLSNKRLKPEEAYLLWKSRDRIEKAFHILQNYLETDRPYVSDEEVFRGYMFASFISLIAYYLVLNVLKKHEVNDKVSVKDALFEFSKVMIEEKEYPTFAEIPKKVKELAEKLGVYDIITKNWES